MPHTCGSDMYIVAWARNFGMYNDMNHYSEVAAI